MNATSSDHGGLKYFSGDSEDQKEYRRWKAWVQAKMLTLDKMPKEARGAYVFTLLSGKALECVEHLEPAKYQTADGEKVLFELLDARFPQKEMSDEMSETLTEIFNLKIHEGESLKAWISRASEMFDRCLRKTNVSFLEEAKGWLILQSVGVDVKWLPGFKTNQQIKALNMVDQGSCFQQAVPFFEQETTEVIRKLFDTHWVKSAGPPQEIIVDQARTNLGEAWLDNQGVSVRMIPARAHWQLGRTESHGGWFG